MSSLSRKPKDFRILKFEHPLLAHYISENMRKELELFPDLDLNSAQVHLLIYEENGRLNRIKFTDRDSLGLRLNDDSIRDSSILAHAQAALISPEEYGAFVTAYNTFCQYCSMLETEKEEKKQSLVEKVESCKTILRGMIGKFNNPRERYSPA